MTDEYLTVEEVADQLRLSKMTVYRLVHTGALPSLRVGRSIRITQASLDVYLGRAAAPAKDRTKGVLGEALDALATVREQPVSWEE